ncbi:MAG: DUF1836 domain-containing protein [Bacillaceae bacterium]
MYNHENEIKNILDFRCPRYRELPTISLYKDQVILYIEETMKPLNLNSTEKILTPTMLNNYVKQKVVSPPENRLYNEKHLAYLIVVCLLKHVYSLTDICQLIKAQIDTYPIEQAYDYFCAELEKSLKYFFGVRDISKPIEGKERTVEMELVQSVCISVSNKLFVDKYLMDKQQSAIRAVK